MVIKSKRKPLGVVNISRCSKYNELVNKARTCLREFTPCLPSPTEVHWRALRGNKNRNLTHDCEKTAVGQRKERSGLSCALRALHSRRAIFGAELDAGPNLAAFALYIQHYISLEYLTFLHDTYCIQK